MCFNAPGRCPFSLHQEQMVAKSHTHTHTCALTHPEGLQINQQDFRCRLTVLPLFTGISQSHTSLDSIGWFYSSCCLISVFKQRQWKPQQQHTAQWSLTSHNKSLARCYNLIFCWLWIVLPIMHHLCIMHKFTWVWCEELWSVSHSWACVPLFWGVCWGSLRIAGDSAMCGPSLSRTFITSQLLVSREDSDIIFRHKAENHHLWDKQTNRWFSWQRNYVDFNLWC